MKKYEKASVDFASKYKAWDHKCTSKDSFLAGFKAASEQNMHEEVEVEFKDGTHQLVDDIRNDSSD